MSLANHLCGKGSLNDLLIASTIMYLQLTGIRDSKYNEIPSGPVAVLYEALLKISFNSFSEIEFYVYLHMMVLRVSQ